MTTTSPRILGALAVPLPSGNKRPCSRCGIDVEIRQGKARAKSSPTCKACRAVDPTWASS